MALRTNRITVRGTSYEVQEPSGLVWNGVKKLLADERAKHRADPYLVLMCCTEPAFPNEESVLELPQSVIAKITAEAVRLMNYEDGDQVSPKVPPKA